MTLVPLGEPAGRDAWLVRSDDGRDFAVFVVDGRFRVTDALCPHNRGPLVDGRIHGGRVLCPWHWYQFDLDTGACLTAARHRLGVHPVLERDGLWFADVGGPPVRRSWAERLRAHARGET